jgi:ribonuclease HI
VAEGETEGILRGPERALAGGADSILVVSDSQAALKGILSTCARAGEARAIKYDAMVRTAMERLPALRITNIWTPAHIGTAGNEYADDAAKAATRLPPSPSLPVSLTRSDISILSRLLTDSRR